MTIDQQSAERDLSAWRQKIDRLRVQQNLLKMELRDRKDEVVKKLDHSYAEAKSSFDKFKDAAGSEREQLGSGFKAAWKAFREAYDEATDE